MITMQISYSLLVQFNYSLFAIISVCCCVCVFKLLLINMVFSSNYSILQYLLTTRKFLPTTRYFNRPAIRYCLNSTRYSLWASHYTLQTV